jgi:hypothetical protein
VHQRVDRCQQEHREDDPDDPQYHQPFFGLAPLRVGCGPDRGLGAEMNAVQAPTTITATLAKMGSRDAIGDPPLINWSTIVQNVRCWKLAWA